MSFDFAYPWVLLGLLLVPLALYAGQRFRDRGSILFSAVPQALAASGGKRSRAGFWLLVLRGLILSLLIIALARPRFGSESREIESSGIDIMLAVDVSGSMLGLDLKLKDQAATRLEVVKSVLSGFIDRRPNDRMGIIAFGSDPYLLSPLTLDHDWLRKNLGRVEVGIIEPGTSIGPPIGMATNRLRRLEDSKSRILILLTDGQDSQPAAVPPTQFAEAAAAFGIKIYTIAVGQDTDVPTYVYDPRTRGIAKDTFGRPIVRRARYPVDEAVLQQIAEIAGGKFYRARETRELESIYSEIDRLERTEIKLRYRTDYEEAYFYPAVAGLLCLVIEQLLKLTRFRRLP